MARRAVGVCYCSTLSFKCFGQHHDRMGAAHLSPPTRLSALSAIELLPVVGGLLLGRQQGLSCGKSLSHARFECRADSMFHTHTHHNTGTAAVQLDSASPNPHHANLHRPVWVHLHSSSKTPHLRQQTPTTLHSDQSRLLARYLRVLEMQCRRFHPNARINLVTWSWVMLISRAMMGTS